VGQVLVMSDKVLITGIGICFIRIQSRYWNDGHVARRGKGEVHT
jgi:hypothetical protein